MRHFLYVPFTGLGLYNGFRGQSWLKNRIQIFKQFTVQSLLAQTNQNFTLWVSWRRQERTNRAVQELERYLKSLFGEDRVVFTYSGICFYDDKFEDAEARERLITALHHTTGELINHVGDVKDVVYTIQPSDDCYHTGMVEEIQTLFTNTGYQAIGYKHGYIESYQTKEVREYNPLTNPPFYSIRMAKEIFLDPFKHVQYTALKKDVGKYKQGTPLPSHEYVGDCLHYLQIPKRGFLVGTHGENISTHFNNPYAGERADNHVLYDFGIYDAPTLHIPYSFRKHIMKSLPFSLQKKLRYIFGERVYQSIYKLITG
jgi:hypothetical protein